MTEELLMKQAHSSIISESSGPTYYRSLILMRTKDICLGPKIVGSF